MLEYKLQVTLFITSLLGLFITISLIRKSILDLRYSFLWIVISFLSIILSVFPGIMAFVSETIGIQTPSNTLYLFGFYFVLCILFSLTVIVSKNARRVKILNQEIAILKNKVEEKNRE